MRPLVEINKGPQLHEKLSQRNILTIFTRLHSALKTENSCYNISLYDGQITTDNGCARGHQVVQGASRLAVIKGSLYNFEVINKKQLRKKTDIN